MNIFASDLQQYIYLLGGLITMIVLIVLLDEQFKIEKKGIIVNSLIIMSFSEILNSIVKLINCLKKTIDKTYICYIQIQVSIFSDICTILMSLIISREITFLLHYNDFSSFGSKSPINIYLIGFFIPLITSIIFFYFEIKKIKRNDIAYVCYISKPELYFGIVIFWILIIISIFYSIKALLFIKKKKKEYIEFEEELITDNEEINSSKENIKFSEKLNQIYQKNLKYPICISIIWIFGTVIRFIHSLIGDEDKYKNLLKYMFVIHSVFSSFRGLIYCFVYFNKENCCCFYDSNEKKETKSTTTNTLIPNDEMSLNNKSDNDKNSIEDSLVTFSL
jgi:hypothetical protein